MTRRWLPFCLQTLRVQFLLGKIAQAEDHNVQKKRCYSLLQRQGDSSPVVFRLHRTKRLQGLFRQAPHEDHVAGVDDALLGVIYCLFTVWQLFEVVGRS